LHLGLVYCVHANSEWLGERSNIQSDVIGNNMEALLGFSHTQQGSETAKGAAATVFADGLGRSSLNNHSIANVNRTHLRAHPIDGARDLMAQTKRFGPRTGNPAHLDVAQVAPADSTGCDSHKCIGWAGFWVGNLVYPNVCWAVHSNL
jgi:hypothetical protein